MTSRAEFLLGKTAESIQAIRDQYSEMVDEAIVDDELLYSVKNAIEGMASALDWTANAVAEKYAIHKSPYFPIAPSADEFPTELEKQLGKLETHEPEVAAAFERHQPYQVGKSELAYLRKLARINKHRDFTAQRRDEHRLTNMYLGNQLLMSLGRGLFIGGRPPITGQLVRSTESVSGDGGMHVVDGTIVDWYFVDPSVSVLATLEALHRIAALAVADIWVEADLV